MKPIMGIGAGNGLISLLFQSGVPNDIAKLKKYFVLGFLRMTIFRFLSAYIKKDTNSMRNSEYLDNPRPEDINIGKSFIDPATGQETRWINGNKIIQSGDRDHDLICNRCRASGLSHSDYFRQIYQG